MTQVWKRNIYQGMFPWAYLPLFIFLWMKWLNEGRILWLFAFAISISVFSHAFAHPGYFFVYITAAGVFAIIKFKEVRKDGKFKLRIFLRCVFALFLAVLFNIWWIYPFIHNSTTSGDTFNAVGNAWKANLNSLIGVSQYFGTFDILRLRQKFYFIKDSPLSTEWYGFYNNLIVRLVISPILLFICIFGIIKSKGQKYWAYLVSLLIIGWFVCKGSNFPFGKAFYSFLFSTFPMTAALRNPYEKFGIIWLLPYSVFFALGLHYLALKFNSTRRKLFLGAGLVLFLGVLVYPIWNGDIFPLKDKLIIPGYYLEANDHLNLNLSKRSFHIPFSTEPDLMLYSWGYLGIDPSENLFDSQNISSPRLPFFNSYYELIPKYLTAQYLPRILGLLGVDYIILHNDFIHPKLDLNIVKINEWKEVTKDRAFDKLTLYKLDNKIVKPEVYIANNLIKFNSNKQAFDKIVEEEFDITQDVFTIDNTNFVSQSVDLPAVIKFNKIAADRYRVQIKRAVAPFILILNNTFNKNWIAKVDNAVVGKHIPVNGFANGWIVDKKGDYTVDILFKIWPWE